MQKVLVVIWVGLMIVLLGEAGYYLWQRQKPQPVEHTVQQSNPPQAMVTKPPQVSLTPLVPKTIDDQILLSIPHLLHKGTIISSSLTNQYHGQIAELTFGGAFGLKLRLKDQENQTNPIGFFKDELPKIQFFKLDSKKTEIPMDKNELKIGDTVDITITVDLIKSYTSNLVNGKIIKVE